MNSEGKPEAVPSDSRAVQGFRYHPAGDGTCVSEEGLRHSAFWRSVGPSVNAAFRGGFLATLQA